MNLQLQLSDSSEEFSTCEDVKQVDCQSPPQLIPCIQESVAVIGGGWYGCHIALKLAQWGKSVTLYEAKDDLFKGASGNYGIRLHSGPHYPRSEVTRKEVQATFRPMLQEYPQFFVDTNPAIYALGVEDVDGNPSKVDWTHFKKVCEECEQAREIDVSGSEYKNLLGAYCIYEPALHMDKPRAYFKQVLPKMGVKILLNHKVSELESSEDGTIVDGKIFDWAINCTYYQDFNELSKFMGAQVCYQACCTLLYEEIDGQSAPYSFTIVDGWFLCLMPYVKNDSQHLVLYHAKYTPLDTFTNMKDCQALLDSLDDKWVEKNLKTRMEADALRFFPQFLKRYRYVGFNSAAATKVKNSHEFRSSLVWAQDRIINVFSGKVNNIFEAANEVKNLMTQTKNNTIDQNAVIKLEKSNSSVIVAPSVLSAEKEIKNQYFSEKDTCSLSMADWEKQVPNQPKFGKCFGRYEKRFWQFFTKAARNTWKAIQNFGF